MTFRTLMPAALLLCAASAAAQTSWDVDLYGRTQKRLGHTGRGSDVHVTSVVWHERGDREAAAAYRDIDHFELTADGRTLIPPFNKCWSGAVRFDCVTVEDVWNAAVIEHVLDRLTEKGYQYGLRQEMEMRSRRYVKLLKEHGLTYDDPQMMLHLQRIYRRIRPVSLPEGRTFHYDLLVIQSPAADSYMLPDGTMVLTTGLLSLMRTEDEVAAVMARETAHLVLDHAPANYHSNRLRQIVLGAVTTLVTDAVNSFTGFSLSGTSEYYSEGTVTTSDVSLVDGMMTAAVGELGLSYSRRQDETCDAVASEVLRTAGYDTDALATALERLASVLRTDRRYVRTLKGYQNGDMTVRIAKAGTPHTGYVSADYERAVAGAISTQAQIMYNEHRFVVTEALVRRNLDSGVFTDDDCIVLASSLLAVHDGEQAALEALALTEWAREMRPGNIQARKPAILALVRLDRREEALEALTQYGEALETFLADKENIRGTQWWEPAYLYTEAEKVWIRRTRAALAGCEPERNQEEGEACR